METVCVGGDLTEAHGVFMCSPGAVAANRHAVVVCAGSNQPMVLDLAAHRWRKLARAPEALGKAYWTGRSL